MDNSFFFFSSLKDFKRSAAFFLLFRTMTVNIVLNIAAVNGVKTKPWNFLHNTFTFFEDSMKRVKCLFPFHLFSAFSFRTDFPVTPNITSPPQTSSPNQAGLASTPTLCMCVRRSEVPSAACVSVCMCVCVCVCGRVLQRGNTCQQSASHHRVQVQ